MECLTISDNLSSLEIPWEKECPTFRVECLSDSFASIEPKKSVKTNTSTNLVVDNSSVPFPWRLHAMLDDAATKSFEHVVSWELDGKAFKVHDPKAFTDTVLPHYCNQTRYKSFQRQLNIYGFDRVARGRDKGLCHHGLLVRGHPSLCTGMQRIKIKESSGLNGHQLQQLLSSQEEAEAVTVTDSSVVTDSSDDSSQEGEILEFPEDERDDIFDKAFFEGKAFYLVDSVDDTSKAALPLPDTEVSSSANVMVNKESRKSLSSNCRNDSFPWKLHDMLQQMEENGEDHIVSWEHDGRALKVHKPKEFVQHILPLYFLHSKKWESFQRQLNLYGFTRVARGHQKGTYLHKYFVRSQRSLCRRITRPR